jgi:hypothetical protein
MNKIVNLEMNKQLRFFIKTEEEFSFFSNNWNLNEQIVNRIGKNNILRLQTRKLPQYEIF